MQIKLNYFIIIEAECMIQETEIIKNRYSGNSYFLDKMSLNTHTNIIFREDFILFLLTQVFIYYHFFK